MHDALTIPNAVVTALGVDKNDYVIKRRMIQSIEFITNGSDNGVVYGRQGQGSGQMPGFGACQGDRDAGERERIARANFCEDRNGTLTLEQIEAIVETVERAAPADPDPRQRVHDRRQPGARRRGAGGRSRVPAGGVRRRYRWRFFEPAWRHCWDGIAQRQCAGDHRDRAIGR